MMEADSGSVRKTDRTQELLRNRTVLDHLPLVMAIAARVRENLPLQVDVDDLISAGLRGLFAAATKNRRRKNLLFDSYVRHRIKAAILDSLRTAFPAQQEFPDRIRKEELIEMLKSAMATVPEPYQKAMIIYYTTDNDHEGHRRAARNQRAPDFRGPQDSARKDGDHAAIFGFERTP